MLKAQTDLLTGALNPPRLEAYGERLIARHVRAAGKPLCLSVIDLYRPIEVARSPVRSRQVATPDLKRVSQPSRAGVLRPGDLLLRFAGDEFLPAARSGRRLRASEIAGRMRVAGSRLLMQLDLATTSSRRVTASVGVACTESLVTRSTCSCIEGDITSMFTTPAAGRGQTRWSWRCRRPAEPRSEGPPSPASGSDCLAGSNQHERGARHQPRYVSTYCQAQHLKGSGSLDAAGGLYAEIFAKFSRYPLLHSLHLGCG